MLVQILKPRSGRELKPNTLSITTVGLNLPIGAKKWIKEKTRKTSPCGEMNVYFDADTKTLVLERTTLNKNSYGVGNKVGAVIKSLTKQFRIQPGQYPYTISGDRISAVVETREEGQ